MEEIVINRMYSGDYLVGNLGHEVINMYQSDSGEYYLYLNDKGSFSLEHRNRVKKMLLVRSTSYKACVEVIGLAEGLSDVYGDDQRQEEVKRQATYGGVTLNDLFDGNEAKQKCYVSFQAQKVYRPEKPIYIVYNGGVGCTDANAVVVHLQSNQAKMSLKQYFSPEDNYSDYEALNSLFAKEIKGEAMPKVDMDVLKKPVEKNFFDACGIDNNELAFSNIFAYFLEKYPTILSEMAATYGHAIDIEGLTITRETENNIDLFVQTRSHWLVIENKVLSSINGRKKDTKEGVSQLDKYYRHINDLVEGKGEEDGKKKKDKKVEWKGEERLYILLAPDHNDVDLSKYDNGDKYKKMYYSQVRNFLVEYKHRHNLHDLYLDELLLAMEKHCQKFYNELFDQTQKRFYQHLNNKRKQLRK